MKFEKILEELKKPENKKKFRDMAKEMHPDKGGDINLMKELNNAKENDETFEEFYNRIKGKGFKKTEKQAREAWKDFFKDEGDRDAWLSKVQKARRKKQNKVRKKQKR